MTEPCDGGGGGTPTGGTDGAPTGGTGPNVGGVADDMFLFSCCGGGGGGGGGAEFVLPCLPGCGGGTGVGSRKPAVWLKNASFSNGRTLPGLPRFGILSWLVPDSGKSFITPDIGPPDMFKKLSLPLPPLCISLSCILFMFPNLTGLSYGGLWGNPGLFPGKPDLSLGAEP